MSLLLTRRGEIFGILNNWYLFLFKNLFIIDQYFFNGVSGKRNFELILAVWYCFTSIIYYILRDI